MDVHLSDDRVVSREAPSSVKDRRAWAAPEVTPLPKLTELTLLSPIGGGGGIGGSTVFGLLLAAGLLFGISACSDQVLDRPSAGSIPVPAAAEQLTCRADVSAGTLECGAATGASRSPGVEMFGEQGVKVGLRSSNNSWNGTSHVFTTDVSVQNEAALAMGTADGVTKDSGGIKVFFLAQPAGDVGNVSVLNPTGTATFTASNQPYFKYDTLLTSQQVSNSQTWQFQLDPSTTSFTFQVLVSAELPNTGAILHWAEEPGVNPTNWEGISGWGTDGLAVFGQYGEVYVRDNGVWQARNDPNGSGEVGPVVAAGPNDLTTMMNDFTTRHWDGISWRDISSLSGGPGSGGLVSFVGGSGKTGACAFGFYQRCFNGSVWTNIAVTGTPHVAASTVIAGNIVALTNTGVVWSRDSSSGVWTQIGGGGSGQTQGPGIIFASDASNIWTLSIVNNSDPVIRYWNGSTWATQADPSGQDNNTGVPLGGVGFSSTDAYIVRADNVGHGHIWHWDGSNWTDVHTAAYNYTGIWARGTDDIYVSEDGGRVEQDSGGSWRSVLVNRAPTVAAWEGSSTNAYLATNASDILHYDGSSWQLSASTSGAIGAIWGSGPSDVWATPSATYLLHSTGSSWTASSTGSSDAFFGVGGSGSHDIWAVGQFGQVYHNDGSSWTASVNVGALISTELYAVWAANANFAVAVGQSGQILKWLGSSWAKDTVIGAASFRSVWGSGPSDVWAVGDGGEAVHYDGTSWTTVSSGTGQNLLGVWVASPSEAYAVGPSKTLLMYNGVSWSPVAFQSANTGSSFNAISGIAGGEVLIAGTRILRGTR